MSLCATKRVFEADHIFMYLTTQKTGFCDGVFKKSGLNEPNMSFDVVLI